MLPGFGAEEVKTIGDEVMIRVDEPVNAVRLGIRIADELAFHGSPPVRVGMHSGPAVARDGDWFGATVNLASRVTRAAKPGEVLLTNQTREQLAGRHGIELEERGAHYFRNLSEPTLVYRALSPGQESKRWRWIRSAGWPSIPVAQSGQSGAGGSATSSARTTADDCSTRNRAATWPRAEAPEPRAEGS